jgi:glycosyltransferase involved in cell wall biosynthesis
MKKKLMRVTTVDLSLDSLIEGQLKFMSQYYDVVGVADDSGLMKKVAEREGVRTVPLKMSREINIVQDFKSLFNLIKLIIKEKPFIVHANTPKGSLLSMIAAWLCFVPVRIYTVTGLRFETTHGIFRFLLKTMERITCFCANTVIPEGDGVKDTLKREHITWRRLSKINNGNINGIDVEHFSSDAVHESKDEIRSRLGLKKEDFVFVFVGRVVKDKGVNELAEAMKKLSGSCKLILVGPMEANLDPIQPENEEFFRTSSDVIATGQQDDIRPFLKAADALVFPSYREGFPNVVLQAGAMGLPSIVTNINGSSEIIIEGENGTVIDAQSVGALIAAMQNFIDQPAELKRMAGNSRRLIVSRYLQQDVWNATLERYNELCKGKE